MVSSLAYLFLLLFTSPFLLSNSRSIEPIGKTTKKKEPPRLLGHADDLPGRRRGLHHHLCLHPRDVAPGFLEQKGGGRGREEGGGEGGEGFFCVCEGGGEGGGGTGDGSCDRRRRRNDGDDGDNTGTSSSSGGSPQCVR